jgi:hypothetical protein
MDVNMGVAKAYPFATVGYGILGAGVQEFNLMKA